MSVLGDEFDSKDGLPCKEAGSLRLLDCPKLARTSHGAAHHAGTIRKEARDVQRTAGASGDGDGELAGRASAHMTFQAEEVHDPY